MKTKQVRDGQANIQKSLVGHCCCCWAMPTYNITCLWFPYVQGLVNKSNFGTWQPTQKLCHIIKNVIFYYLYLTHVFNVDVYIFFYFGRVPKVGKFAWYPCHSNEEPTRVSRHIMPKALWHLGPTLGIAIHHALIKCN